MINIDQKKYYIIKKGGNVIEGRKMQGLIINSPLLTQDNNFSL